MPGEYPSKQEMERRREEDFAFSDRAKHDATGSVVHGHVVSPTGRPAPKPSATVVRLAVSLGKSPDELQAAIPEDTLKRLRWPMKATRTEDGKTIFEHDLGIVEGIRALIKL